jgi:hypothetical protein
MLCSQSKYKMAVLQKKAGGLPWSAFLLLPESGDFPGVALPKESYISI